jgi:hypothetical protein
MVTLDVSLLARLTVVLLVAAVGSVTANGID